jgi:hypothetical protein
MLSDLRARLHAAHLELHGRWLRRREQAALRRLGEEIASRPAGGASPELAGIRSEIERARREIEALAAEGHASLDADGVDLARVASWMRPAVVARGACARLVLRHRIGAVHRGLRTRYEALGRLASHMDERTARREIADLRAGLERVAAERERRLSRLNGRALPAWTARMGAEAEGLGRAIVAQLRSHLLPKAPALAGMVVGWWIAQTYTDSHVRSVLRSVGIGSGGTRVVSGSTYKAMSFWMPLLAAALCAYLGERLAAYYGQRTRAGTAEEGARESA